MLALTMLRRSWPASCRSSAIAGAKSLNFSLTIGGAGSPRAGLATRRTLAPATPAITVERNRLCQEPDGRKQRSVTIETPGRAEFESNSRTEMSVTISLRPTGSPVRGTSEEALVTEFVIDLGIDLPRVVPMKTPEGQTVV